MSLSERHCHFLDHVNNAAKAMDWRPSGSSASGSGNTLAESIFKQMADEDYSMPEWVVCPLGETGEHNLLERVLRSACQVGLCVPVWMDA